MKFTDFKYPEKVLQTFWSRIDRNGPEVILDSPCWLWTGYTQCERNSDHGVMGATVRGRPSRPFKAHRISWMIRYGDVPDDLCVCHRCDVPQCVRPDHLFLGTRRENWQDMRAKGRQAAPPVRRGAENNTALLQPDQVLAIYERRQNGEKASRLAVEFGVRVTTISSICHRKIWRHLLEERFGPPDITPIRRVVAVDGISRGQQLVVHLECGHIILPTHYKKRWLTQKRGVCKECSS